MAMASDEGPLAAVPSSLAARGAEESDLYPALDRLLGGADPTATMSRAHAEIAYEIARLGRLIVDIGDRVPR
jgi:hypothetical protein